MKIARILFIVLAITVWPVIWGYAEDSDLFAGINFWYADTKAAKDPALMWGGRFDLRFNENCWPWGTCLISGNFLTGTFQGKYSDGSNWDTGMFDSELALIYHFQPIFYLGIGARYSQIRFDYSYVGKDSEPVDRYGPMLYFRVQKQLSNLCGWYGKSSLMPWDLADRSGEHYNLEGGGFVFYRGVTARLGYRYTDFYNYSGDSDFQGPTAELSYHLF